MAEKVMIPLVPLVLLMLSCAFAALPELRSPLRETRANTHLPEKRASVREGTTEYRQRQDRETEGGPIISTPRLSQKRTSAKKGTSVDIHKLVRDLAEGYERETTLTELEVRQASPEGIPQDLERRNEDECSMQGCEKYHDYCYVLKDMKQSWNDAKTTCEEMSANLVEVNSMQVNEFLERMVGNAGCSGMDGPIWLGLNDIAEEGTFVWASSNKSAFFTYWRPGEPNDGGGNEDCVHIVHEDFRWKNTDCSTKSRFICQFSMN